MTGAHRNLRVSTLLTLALSLHAIAPFAIGTARAATSGSTCLRDAASLSQDTICTANDVRIAQFDVLGTCKSTGSQNGKVCVAGYPSDPCVLQGGMCVAVQSCILGRQITIPIRSTVIAGAKERYDIGVYVAQDGGDAKGNPLTIPHGGMCYRDYLHPVSSTNNDLQLMSGHGPYYNAEIGVTPPDTCGDLAQSQQALYDFGAIMITCRDEDHNGILDVGTCLSWDINKQTTCKSEKDAIPNSSSKCRCESIPVGSVTVCGDGIPEGVEGCDEGANNGSAASCCTVDCVPKPAGTSCRPAIGVCDAPEFCTGSGACPTDTLKPSTTVCRASAGVCDLADFCTGSSSTCPPDAKSTAVCRATAGDCDVAESCDGVSNNCPADVFKPATTECRATAGVCDLAESCTGSSASCPADAKSTAPCRAAADVCDAAESCDGAHNDCPADLLKPATAECRAAAGVCDLAENCTGSSVSCPANVKSTAVCRATAGDCDVAESCDGVSNNCPADVFKPATTECRANAGACDLAESCTGSSASCPADAKSTALCRAASDVCDAAESCDGTHNDCPTDAFKPATTQCRAAAGACDAAENCTGSSAGCPVDGKSSAVCRPAADVCDVAESCDGTHNDCPIDAFRPASSQCRAAAGVCDLAESCTGSGTACPADTKSTAVCRPAADMCDVAESCDGSHNDCPTDAFKPATTQCRAAAGVCDLAENCTGSSAGCPTDAKSTAVCRVAAGDCDVTESCDGAGNTCPADTFKPATTQCRTAAGICDLTESCTGSSANCPADAKSTAVCRPAADVCDAAESCDGSHNDCPVDAFKPSTTQCRAAAGVCDLAERCTGSGVACPDDVKSTDVCRVVAGDCDLVESCDGVTNDCPADSFKPSTSECRTAAGVCDVTESCTGSSAGCPADAKSTAGCRPATDVCDAAESCDGTHNDCPTDSFKAATTQCRAAAGVCDLAESCTGSSAACPPDARSTAVCRAAGNECDVTERCDGNSTSCPDDVVQEDGTPCRDTDRMSCTTAACVQGQCEQRYQVSCACDLDVTKAGCVVPSNGADCDGQVSRMSLQYTRETCSATHDSQGAGKVACTDVAPLPATVRILVTSASDASKIYADVSGVPVGGIVTATAANAGATTVATSTRVKIFSGTSTLLQEIVYDTSCTQALNLGDQFGSLLLVGLKTSLGGDLSYDPSHCSAALPAPAAAPNCLGKIEVLRLRYDGGGCAAMLNSQTAGKVTCTQLVNTPYAAPARIRVTDAAGSIVWFDAGAPASIQLGDIVDVIAASVSGKTTLSNDTIVNVLNGSGTLIEQMKFKTDCSQPVNLGDQFGGLTVFGMRTTNGGATALGSDVHYTYTITNTGTGPADMVTVDDDKLGMVPGAPIASLPAGTSMTLSADQLVEDTTINTVTVLGNGGTCSADAKAAVLATCVLGYPYASTDPRTSVLFNESGVLRAFQPAVAGAGDRLMVFYNDEHALTLGVRRVTVKSSTGTTTMDYPVSPLTANPSGVLNPSVGTMALDGDQAGTDTSACAGFPDRCDRPMFPALFITDVTDNPDNRAGDWQSGGTPIAPHAVYGTWKAAVKTVDKTKNPPAITVTPDTDPAKNDWKLGSGDPAPAGLADEGYGAEIVWNVDALNLAPGRVYRVQMMVHDGDQNSSGGDTGESCATVFIR